MAAGKGSGDGEVRVRIYDFETKTISTIPAAELAPGMICGRVQGVEGEVWVDGSRLNLHPYQHPPFPEEVRDLFREIKASLDEVYPLSLEQWEDGFRRDHDPMPEIEHWLRLAQIFSRLTAPDAAGPQGLSLQKKRDIFRILIGCGISPRDQVLTVTDRGSLTREEAEQVVTAFFDN